MQRSAGGLREELETRLTSLERQAPEWRGWLHLLRETLRIAARTDCPEDALMVGQWDRKGSRAAPLLQGQSLRVDPREVRDGVRRIVGAATGWNSLSRYRPTEAESLQLLSAALRQDAAALDELTRAAGMEGGALGAVAQLVAWPLLQACGRRLADQIPADWQQGFCPICGAWPTLAELRGLERARRLRCGWCAADWPLPWLCCPFCGERRHERLGSLVVEDRRDTRRVETCQECRGYLKTITTLRAMSPPDVLLGDLETVELDLVARERGWTRPAGPGHRLELQVLPR